MAKAGTSRNDARASNHGDTESHCLTTVTVKLPFFSNGKRGSQGAVADFTPQSLTIIRDAVRQDASKKLAVHGAACELVRIAGCVLEHAFAGAPSDRNKHILKIDLRRKRGAGATDDFRTFYAWQFVLLDEWLVAADRILQNPRYAGEIDAVKAVAEVATFAGMAGFVHEIAIDYGRLCRALLLESLVCEGRAATNGALGEDMLATDIPSIQWRNGPVKSFPDDIVARIFKAAKPALLRVRCERELIPTDLDRALLRAKLEALIAKLPRPERKGPPANQEANATEAANTGPTVTDLAEEVDVSDDTVWRVRDAAGIVVNLRGAAARNRRHPPGEVDRMIKAAMAGTFLKRREMAKAWAKWATKNAADKPHASK